MASGIPDLIRSYREVKMPYLESTEKSKKDATPASLAIEELRKQNAFRSERFPALIAVDIREWVGKTHLPHFRVVLEKLFEGNNAPFIFRVPLLEEKKLRQIESDIADIRNVQTVVTNQTTIDEYLLYAHRIAKERNAAIAKEAEELLAKCFIEERNRGNFRGFCTVEKIVDEILYRKILEMAEK